MTKEDNFSIACKLFEEAFNRIIIKRDLAYEGTNLIIPSELKKDEAPPTGTIIGFGPETELQIQGWFGKKVMFKKMAGNWINIKGFDYYICNDDDIMVRLDNNLKNKFEAAFNIVVFKRDLAYENTSLLLTDRMKKKEAPNTGILVEYGPDVDKNIKGWLGDRVMFNHYSGSWIKIEDEEYFICNDTDIFVKIK